MIELINQYIKNVLDPDFHIHKGMGQNFYYRSKVRLCQNNFFEIHTIDDLYILLFQLAKSKIVEKKDNNNFAHSFNSICLRMLESILITETERKISLLIHSTIHYQTDLSVLYNGAFYLLLYRSLYGKDEMYNIFCTFLKEFITDSLPDLKYIKGFLLSILLEDEIHQLTINTDKYQQDILEYGLSINSAIIYKIEPVNFFMKDQGSVDNFSNFLYLLCSNIEVLIKFKSQFSE